VPRCRLMVNFASEQGLANFMAEAKKLGLVPEEAGVYEADSLDFQAKGADGVGRKHSYVLLSGESGLGRVRLKVSREEEV
jgi:hypothetical protein